MIVYYSNYVNQQMGELVEQMGGWGWMHERRTLLKRLVGELLLRFIVWYFIESLSGGTIGLSHSQGLRQLSQLGEVSYPC